MMIEKLMSLIQMQIIISRKFFKIYFESIKIILICSIVFFMSSCTIYNSKKVDTTLCVNANINYSKNDIIKNFGSNYEKLNIENNKEILKYSKNGYFPKKIFSILFLIQIPFYVDLNNDYQINFIFYNDRLVSIEYQYFYKNTGFPIYDKKKDFWKDDIKKILRYDDYNKLCNLNKIEQKMLFNK